MATKLYTIGRIVDRAEVSGLDTSKYKLRKLIEDLGIVPEYTLDDARDTVILTAAEADQIFSRLLADEREFLQGRLDELAKKQKQNPADALAIAEQTAIVKAGIESVDSGAWLERLTFSKDGQ